MRHLLSAPLAVLMAMAAATAPASAQPLADKLPGDALVYIGWQGSANLTPAYQQSHLKAVIDASQLADLLQTLLPQLVQKIQTRHAAPSGPPPLDGGLLLKHPTALYFGGIGADAQARPAPLLALLCDAGADAPAISQWLSALVARQPPDSDTWRTGVLADGLVYFADAATAQELQSLQGGDASAGRLAQAHNFQSARARANPQTVLTVWADLAALLALADQSAANAPTPDARRWPAIKEVLGLAALKQLVYVGGFDGPDWRISGALLAPAPRGGFIAGLAPQPINQELLRQVPATATLAAAANLDLADLFGQLRAALATIDPQVQAQFERNLSAIQTAIGLDLHNDLFAPLGPQWVCFTDRGVAGPSLLGLAVVNRLRDAPKAEASLAQLAPALNRIIAANAPPQGPTVRLLSTRADDVTIHYLGIPFITPSWAVADGNLYLGLFPQTVAAAVRTGARAGHPSILENPSLSDLRQRLGAPADAAFSFADVPQTADQAYASVLMLSRIYLGFADMFGLDAPALLVPTLQDLRPHLKPVAAFAWSDDAGIHFESLSPFPGTGVLGSQQDMLFSQQAMMLGVLLPALGAARQSAQDTASAAQLRQISAAALQYSVQYGGELPPDLMTLVRLKLVPPQTLLAPRDRKRLPPDISRWPPQGQHEWLAAQTSYAYPGALHRDPRTVADPSGRVLVFEKPHLAAKGTLAVGFYDGHVARLPLGQVRLLVQQQTGRSLEQWAAPPRPLVRAATRPVPRPALPQ